MKIFESIQNSDKQVGLSEIELIVKNDFELFEKMDKLRKSISVVKLAPNGENELMELLFSGLGGDVYFPRKGDNSERFDATITFPNYKVVTEIEIPSTEILDAPRNLLDDYAVMHCRKGEDANNIIPLVICWDLPNRRTDYWNVVTDIYNILGIKIKTISILALALYYWTDTPLDLCNDGFFLNYDNFTMHDAEKVLQKYKMSIEDFSGYFSPFK